MLDQHQPGEETDFERFMERYGDFFPENPREHRRAARGHGASAWRRCRRSQLDEHPSNARQLQGPVRAVDRGHGPALAGRPTRPEPPEPVPPDGVEPQLRLQRTGPAGLRRGRADDAGAGRHQQLENLLRGATSPGALAEVDLDRARELLGQRRGREPGWHLRAGPPASRRPASSRTRRVASS